MGCINNRHLATASNTNPNKIPIKISLEDAMLSRHNDILSMTTKASSNKHPSYAPCLKFRIIPDEQSYIPEAIQYINRSSISCTGEFHQTMIVYLNFCDLYNFLDSQVHGICIKDFSLTKAFEIIIIRSLINDLNLNCLNIIEKFPFFSFKSESSDDLMISWQGLTSLMKEIKKNQSLYENFLRVNYIMKLMNEVDADNKQLKKIKKIVQVLRSNASMVKEMFEFIKVSARKLKCLSMRAQEEIMRLTDIASQCRMLNINTPQGIVHYFYVK